jgi:hypothetical protein
MSTPVVVILFEDILLDAGVGCWATGIFVVGGDEGFWGTASAVQL